MAALPPVGEFNPTWAYATNAATSNAITVNYDFNTDSYRTSMGVERAPRGEESALAWLDRRVAEICVKL